VKLDKKHWFEHVPKSIETSHGGKVTILWNQVITDRTIPNNKPDIIIRDNILIYECKCAVDSTLELAMYAP
jgi:hypothetical protein